MRNRKVYKENKVWNRWGPSIPLWFRNQLKRIDKDLVVQFIPPTGYKGCRGANPTQFPFGVVHICKRLPRTGFLSPRVVWSLMDSSGRYSPPGPDTIRIIRTAYCLQRRGQMDRLEEMFEESVGEIRRAMEVKSKERLGSAMRKYASANFERSWPNRVCFRRKVGEPQDGTVVH